MPIQSAEDLLTHVLHDIRDAETEAARFLKAQLKQVENPQLQQFVEQRLEQGQFVLEGVREGLKNMGQKLTGEPNLAARGILEQVQKLSEEIELPELKQAAFIAGLQYLEHYCIAAWGTVKALARRAGQPDLVQVMERALEDGKRFDQQLTELAETDVNPAALQEGQTFANEQGGGEASSDEGRGSGKSKGQGSEART